MAAGSALPGLAAAQQAATGASATDQLLAQVSAWVAITQNVAPAQVQIAPLDVRVQVQTCAQALVMDFPFASRETVRVRCTAQPPWQLYLRLQPPSRTGPTGTSANSANTANPPAAQTKTTVVARALIHRGTLLQPGMLEEVSVSAQGLDPQAVSSLQDLLYAETLRDVPAGSVLRSYDFRRAVLVKRGQTALLTSSPRGNFEVTIRVEAMQDGRMGEQINLKNTESGRLLSGTVTGPNAVRGL